MINCCGAVVGAVEGVVERYWSEKAKDLIYAYLATAAFAPGKV